MTNTDRLATARATYAAAIDAAEVALQARLDALTGDAARDVNHPANVAAFAPYYEAAREARAAFDVVARAEMAATL